MNGIMLVQQGLCFRALRLTVLAFNALLFGPGCFSIASNVMSIGETMIGLVLGLSLPCIGWSLILMLMGAVLIGLSALAVRLNKQYIRQAG